MELHMKFLKFLLVSALSVTVLFSLYSCGLDNEDDVVALSTFWNGSWNSFNIYVDDYIDTVITEEINRAEGTPLTAALVAEGIKEWLRTDFTSCTVKGNTLTLYDVPQGEDGEVVETILYKFVDVYSTEYLGEEYSWYVFESDRTDKYKYFVAFPSEIEEGEDLEHFHFRYGNEDISTIVDYANSRWTVAISGQPWLATVIKPDSPEYAIENQVRSLACMFAQTTATVSDLESCF
jgi:Zn/Cd-binding protein ZinT